MRSEAVDELTFVERARREQMVAGAVEVLATRGYTGASLAAIARHLGISKGLICYHFGGKDDLLRSVVDAVLTQAGTYMTARLTVAVSSLDAVRTYVTSNLDYLATHPTEVLALGEILTHVRAADGVTPLYAAHGAEAVRQLAGLLAQGQHDNALGEFSPFVAAVIIRASIDAVTTLLRDQPDLDLAAYAAALTTLVERMVTP